MVETIVEDIKAKMAETRADHKTVAPWAADLAPYQSPTFRAISISPAQDDGPKRGTVVMHTIEQVREQLILRGVPPDQLGRALIGPPPMIEHDDHGEKKR
jgi:hypothetical protein